MRAQLCPPAFTLVLHLCAAAALSFSLVAYAQTHDPGLRLDWLIYGATAAALSWVLHALSREDRPSLKRPPVVLLYGAGVVIVALARTLQRFGDPHAIQTALIGQALAQLILLYSLGSWRKLNARSGNLLALPTPLAATAVLISGVSGVLAAWHSSGGTLAMAVFGLWCVVFALTTEVVTVGHARRSQPPVRDREPATATRSRSDGSSPKRSYATPRGQPPRNIAAPPRFVTAPRPPPSATVLRGASFAREPTVVLHDPSEEQILGRLRARSPAPPPPPIPSQATLELALGLVEEESASFSLPFLEPVDMVASATEPSDLGPVIPTEWDPHGLAPTRRGPRPKAALFSP